MSEGHYTQSRDEVSVAMDGLVKRKEGRIKGLHLFHPQVDLVTWDEHVADHTRNGAQPPGTENKANPNLLTNDSYISFGIQCDAIWWLSLSLYSGFNIYSFVNMPCCYLDYITQVVI